MCRCKNVTVKVLRHTPKMKRRSLATVREEPSKSSRNGDFAIYIMVTTTAVLSYVNSLNGDFVHDDIPAIVTNGDVTGANSLKHLFLDDFWGTPMADVNSHKSYRPLTTLSFRLNHALAGLRPWWWHACNVALHAACCVLVARACVTIARLQRPFAALAALLFAVHPVHTEAVAGVVGRADVLACIFFLSSLLVYHRPTSNKKCVWLSIVLGALSMLAKETGVTILMLNLAFDFYRCWPYVKRSICSLKIEKKCTGLSIRSIKVILSLALLICLRLALLQGTWPTFSPQDNPAAFHPSFFVRLMTFCYLAAFNWWLMLCPWSLSHDWQMGSVPLITSGWDPRNLLTCAAFGALLLLCYRFIADLEVQRHTPAVIGLLLLVIPFVPASNLLVTVGFVIAERVLYIPSVGSVIITAYGVQLMWYSKPWTKGFLVIGLALLAASGVARTYKRNADWRDRATLLRADLVTLPQNAKLHYNLGNFLRESEQQDSAIRHYKEALRLWPSYASAHNNIGTLVSGMDNAEHHFLQAIKYNRHHVNAHYNLGKLYKKSGQTIQAIKMLEKCIWLQPRFVQAHVELLALKPESEKKSILTKLVELEPNNWEHFVLYGDWLRMKGLQSPASKYYLEALKLNFKNRNIDKPIRGDLIAFRYTVLMYRSLGQKSRILQLLTRWHTWRRGWPSAAAAHMYLRDWRLKMELEGRVQIYSKAVNPTKTTTCFDHSQLSGEVKKATEDKTKKYEENKNQLANLKRDDKKVLSADSDSNSACECKKCGTKKRNVSISSQIKTTHNKSEIGHKEKKCSLHRKDKTVKNSGVIPNIGGLSEHILMKTF
ncbi:protein O-mannosyl-transferase TMTC1-like [Galleria mellonella]|uniref:dolichyl-phosphate-mannose--protein mannosyltransferase n=1 Tax=Galleria mellonella TaxID=7137 RepID=A0A6J3BXD3_GALME|nr:protein O-mannosyl-transferase TMTC1-like [Galleria mellonella]